MMDDGRGYTRWTHIGHHPHDYCNEDTIAEGSQPMMKVDGAVVPHLGAAFVPLKELSDRCRSWE